MPDQDAFLTMVEDGKWYAPATAWQGFLLGYLSGVIWYLGSCYWVFHVMHYYGNLGDCDVRRVAGDVLAVPRLFITGCSGSWLRSLRGAAMATACGRWYSLLLRGWRWSWPAPTSPAFPGTYWAQPKSITFL